jgi:predicted ATP-dependent serine protease
LTQSLDAVEPKSSAAAGRASKRRQRAVTSRTAINVKPRKVEWLWPGFIPFGAITVLAGQPGLGKSLLTVKLAADFSAGRLAQSGTVLMLTAEDPVAEVVVPRLKAARAKLSAVHFGEVNAGGLAIPLQFPADVEDMTELVREHGARLLVIDPLSAHFEGRIDSWKDQSIREALAPLAGLAEKHDLAVLVVAHLNKGRSVDPLQRLGGSIGLAAAARSVLLLGRDPDDPQGESGSRRVLAHVKSNFGAQTPSLAFEVTKATVSDELAEYSTAAIWQRGTSPYQGSDLLQGLAEGEFSTVTAEAVAFLKLVLADGPKTAKEVEAAAAEAAIPWETIKRSKRAAGVNTHKQRGVANGPWLWELDASDESMEQPAA